MENKNNLLFRAMEPGDEYLLFEMENRPEAFRLGETRIPYSLDYLRHFVESSLSDNFISSGQLRLIVCQPPAPNSRRKTLTGKPPAGPDNPDHAETAANRLASARAWSLPPIGILDFFNYEALHLRAEIGILLFPESRHQGLGEKILAQACSYARNQLNLHQLYAQVRTDNPASLKLFESCGFDRCDYRKDWIRAGNRWIDIIGLQRILG